MAISKNEFRARVERCDVRGRSLLVSRKPSDMRDALWVNFYNVPLTCTHHVDQDSNRVLLAVRGFHKTHPDAPADRLRLHLVVSAFPSERGFREKEAEAETILAFLTEFLEGVARDFEPRIARRRRPKV